MSALFIVPGSRFGRFAVLLLALPAVLAVGFWVTLLDDYTLWFFLGAFIAVPLAMMTMASLFGLLFAGFRRSKTEGVSREQAPGLWALWEYTVGKKRAARSVISLTASFNASVHEERTILRLLGQRMHLSVGIPLLAVTDTAALAAILAHEDAHLRFKDTNGGLNLAEFENSLMFIFDYAPPGRSISGTLLYVALGWLSESFQKESIRLSRDAEIRADRHAANEADATARALILVSAAGEFFREKVYDPLDRELMGAMSRRRRNRLPSRH